MSDAQSTYILADVVTRRPKERGGVAGFIVTSRIDGSSEWIKAATFDKLAIPRQTPWDWAWRRAVDIAACIILLDYTVRLALWIAGA